MERTTLMRGKPLALTGGEIHVGQAAPDFKVSAGDLSAVTLTSGAGKTRLIVCLPSVDTPVCEAETRRFNEEASKLGAQVETWIISMDLPFAQKRFCAAAGIQNIKLLSDYREASFGQAFGTLIGDLRLLSRAIFIVNPQGIVTYLEYVPEVTNHPNYDAALAALQKSLATATASHN